MHLAGATRGAMMKRQGKIRIGVREAFIHQTAPIEEGSNDNGKCVAILRHGGGHFHITVALTKCAGCKLAAHRSAQLLLAIHVLMAGLRIITDTPPLSRRTHSRVGNKAPFLLTVARVHGTATCSDLHLAWREDLPLTRAEREN